MHFLKKSLFFLVLALVVALIPIASALSPGDYNDAAPESLVPDHLYGKYCILVNADSGEVLLQKNADTKCYPASTTKIMTCILALESGLVGTRVMIPANISVPSDSSKMGISAGDKMDFLDLLYGMMISSGNDAALAIAQLVSGTETEFVNLMNAKAAELGMTGTHYVNPHGYHKVNHYTTARDLATLTCYAMQNNLFRDIVSAKEHTVVSDYYPKGIPFESKYDLLFPNKALYYEPCVGVKSGSTKAAGRCFVGAAQSGNITLVSVTLMTDPDDKQYSQAFLDTIHMFRYGFLQYKSLTFRDLLALCSQDMFKSLKVENAAKNDPYGGVLYMDSLTIANMPSDYTEMYRTSNLNNENYLLSVAKDFAARLEFDANMQLTAPIHTGDVLGNVYYTAPTGEIYTGKLVSKRDIEEEPPTMDKMMDDWIDDNAPFLSKLMPRRNPPVRILYWLLLAGVAVLVVTRVRRARRRNRERQRILMKKRQEYIRRQKQQEAYFKAHPEARKAAARKASASRQTSVLRKK